MDSAARAPVDSALRAPLDATPRAPVDAAPRSPLCATVPAESGRIPSPRCPVCASPVGEPAHRCERCDTPHHPECWDYLGGCAVFGCQRPVSRPSASPGSPSPSPAPILPLASDLADLIRRQSRSLSIISGGLFSCFALPLLLALLALVVLVVLDPGGGSTYGEAAADYAAWAVGYRVAVAGFVVGLFVTGWGLLTLITATVHRRRVEAALTSSLGAPFSVGGADRSRILDRLDLNDGDRRTIANGESMGNLAPWLGLAALVMTVMMVVARAVGQRALGDWYFFLDLHVGPILAPYIATPLALIAFLRSRGALRLVDLRVTLNRIEAAGKGAMDVPDPANDAR